MSSKRIARVELTHLDGPRSADVELPEGWEAMTPKELEAVWRPVWRQLLGDSVAFTVTVDGVDIDEAGE